MILNLWRLLFSSRHSDCTRFRLRNLVQSRQSFYCLFWAPRDCTRLRSRNLVQSECLGRKRSLQRFRSISESARDSQKRAQELPRRLRVSRESRLFGRCGGTFDHAPQAVVSVDLIGSGQTRALRICPRAEKTRWHSVYHA